MISYGKACKPGLNADVTSRLSRARAVNLRRVVRADIARWNTRNDKASETTFTWATRRQINKASDSAW